MTLLKIRLLEESATDEIVGMQGGYAQIRSLVSRHQRRCSGRKRRQSLWSSGRKTTLQAERPNLSPKWRKALPKTALSITENGRMRWNNSMFCNELINYAVGIFSLDFPVINI